MKVVLPLFLVAFIAAAAMADTVTLKSGEVFHGDVVSETDQRVVIELTVSPGVTDDKTISKNEVASITMTPPDEKAFRKLKDRKLDARSYPVASYNATIKDLEAFVKAHPRSKHTPAVRKILSEFKQEQTRVKAGDVKWDNIWYTKEEAKKNRYQLNAQMLLSFMRDQAANREFIRALNTFDQIERSYSGAPAFPDAAELAQTMVRVAAVDMVAIQQRAQAEEIQYNNGIILVPEPQKTQTIELRKTQIAAAEAALEAVEKAGVKWKPLYQLAPRSFEILKKTLETEAPRIEKLPVANMRNSLAVAKEAMAELSKGDNLEDAEARIAEAKSLWPQNAMINDLLNEWKAQVIKARAAVVEEESKKEESKK